MTEKEILKIAQNKLSVIEKFILGRNIWIYGAGTAGQILADFLNKNNLQISGFIDKNTDKIQDKNGFPVKRIEAVNPKTDYMIISLQRYDDTIVRACEAYGFTPDDYYYFFAGELYNKEDIIYKGCKIGRYTYGYESLLEFYPIAKSIGRFCSINGTARIWNNHPVDYISTHPFLDHPIFYPWEQTKERDFYIKKYGKYFDNAAYEKSELRNNQPVVIGNDVWIGANAVLLPGIHIGDGAIIAAGAVATHDVEDYAIVGGVPAKLIRYRFENEVIDQLKKIQWWNWDEEKINKNIEMFYQPDLFLKNIENIEI